MKTNLHFLLYLGEFFLECVWDNVQKYCTAWQATDDNMAHAHSMLDTLGYKQTIQICNTYCISTGTVVARTHLSVSLCVHCFVN